MVGFTAVNTPGLYYAEMAEFNPFAVLCLLPDPNLSLRVVKSHTRRHVVPHVAIPGTSTDPTDAPTHGPRVPIWVQVNNAKELLTASETKFAEAKVNFAGRTLQTWDCYAKPGTAAAKLPTRGKSCALPFPCPSRTSVTSMQRIFRAVSILSPPGMRLSPFCLLISMQCLQTML